MRIRNRGEDRDRDDVMNDAWNNNAQLMGADVYRMGTLMSQVVSHKNDNMNKKDYKTRLFDLVKEDQLSKYYSENIYPSRELVFLQSQSNFIEKTLGQGERIKIRFECLVAHSHTVKISRTPVHDFELNHNGQLQLFSSKNKFITLQGPGLVYIDM